MIMLEPADLERIPFTLKVPDCPVTFMDHKRLVVHVSRDAAAKTRQFCKDALPIDSPYGIERCGPARCYLPKRRFGRGRYDHQRRRAGG